MMMTSTPEPHNHWWRRAFHTTRRAYYQWHMHQRNATAPNYFTPGRFEPTKSLPMETGRSMESPMVHVDFEKVLIYLVNMIFFYLCIRLFFRFMRQMRERRLQRGPYPYPWGAPYP
uniref:RSN1_TM domain-containing protein n=1 Tax=Steinernema glaseri TaxID=37863 RepID=A0A1I7Z2R5_9BILA